MKSLFGRNITILRGSEASVLSILDILPNYFSISVCVLAPQFVHGLLIINPLSENLL